MSGIDDQQNVLKIMNALVKQSQGNFLFVREVLQFSLTSTAENYGNFSLPQTLSDIYQRYFERAFPTKTCLPFFMNRTHDQKLNWNMSLSQS